LPEGYSGGREGKLREEEKGREIEVEREKKWTSFLIFTKILDKTHRKV
jgi:hypothetical protein